MSAKQVKKEEENVIKADVDFDAEGNVLEIRVHDCKNSKEQHVIDVDKVNGREKLSLKDHTPDEIEAEETLARLGGQPCACVAMLLWERQSAEAEE